MKQNKGEEMILNELKALANEKRLKIIYSLSIYEFCQVHIMTITGLSQVDASRNLKVLVAADLLESQKKGNRVMYKLSDKMQLDYSLQLELIKKEYSYLSYDLDIEQLIATCQGLS